MILNLFLIADLQVRDRERDSTKVKHQRETDKWKHHETNDTTSSYDQNSNTYSAVHLMHKQLLNCRGGQCEGYVQGQ